MNPEVLKRYESNEDRHGSSPDLFRDLRRRLDEELRGGGMETRLSTVAGGTVGDLSDDDDEDDDDDALEEAGASGEVKNRLSEDDSEDEDGDRLQFDPSYYSHGMSGNTSGGSRMLRMELGGLDGYDHGGLRRFVTTTNSKSEEMDSGGSAPSSTPSPQSPLQPLSTMACGGERKVFIALQMSHLMDLLLFSKEIDCRLSDKEQPKDTPSNSDASEPGGSSGIGACSGGGAPVDDIIIKTTADTTDEELIERLERIHRVGCFTCPMTMHEWTATTPKTVFALLRANITLLVHCEPTDPQLPGICQRLRRLSHFLVGTPSSTSSSGSTTSEAADRGRPPTGEVGPRKTRTSKMQIYGSFS